MPSYHGCRIPSSREAPEATSTAINTRLLVSEVTSRRSSVTRGTARSRYRDFCSGAVEVVLAVNDSHVIEGSRVLTADMNDADVRRSRSSTRRALWG